MKTCTTCRQTYPLESFGMSTKRGKPYRLPMCKGCKNDWQRENFARHKKTTASDPLNQAASLWFGPVNRSEPLRHAA